VTVRFLRARKHNKLLSFLTVSAVVGIMLGVATLIIVVSVMDGFTENLKKKFLGSNPHIIISQTDGSGINDWQEVLKDIEKLPNVTKAYPFVLGQAMLSNDKKVLGVIVNGVLPEDDSIAKIVVRGSHKLNNTENGIAGILLGKEMLYSLGVNVGSEVTLVSPVVTRGAFAMIPKMTKFKVVGLFDTGMYEHNRTLVYINIVEAQKFYKLGSAVNEIGVLTDNANKANIAAENIQIELNSKQREYRFWVRDWLTMNTSLFSALKLEEYAMFIVLTLITIVASFNIVSMITVTVKDKRREIAILKAMGASGSFIEKIFVKQGLFIGLLGTVLGNLLALLVAVFLKNFKVITIPKEIYFSETVPLLLSPYVFIFVSFCSLLIAYIAAKIPARITAKIDPLESIRNE
jgi:lipoprotein-releasing system permease protein